MSVEMRKQNFNQMLFLLYAAVVSIMACVLFLIYSGNAAEAVRRGITICGASVIPSLFPMMFLSQYIVKSGAADLAGSLLDKPARLLFGLPGICGVALLTALIGGYPAGARAAETLVSDKKITRREGERLVNMAFCSGPGFAIGMIGAELYKNKTAGLLILTAQAISCIIIGIAQRLISGSGNVTSSKSDDSVRNISRSPDAFVQSAANTASTMLNMCSFIILFQVITEMLNSSGVNNALGMLAEHFGFGEFGRIILPCAAEVTAGSMLSMRFGIQFTAFVAGFGGLSVHFQNFAICSTVRPRKSLYILTRMTQGAICSLIVWLALKLPFFSSMALPTSGNAASTIPAEFSRVSVGFGCAMLVMCLMSVICLPSEKEITDQ